MNANGKYKEFYETVASCQLRSDLRIEFSFAIQYALDSRLGTGSVDGPSVLMEGVRGQHEHHNKKNNNKEENKGWFAILLLLLLQPYAAACDLP